MQNDRPFIPRDKPKSFVVFMLAGLAGLACGAVGFVGAWACLPWLKALAFIFFGVAWLVTVVMWFKFVAGMLTGRYRAMEPKEWKEQLW